MVMWPFTRKTTTGGGIRANTVFFEDGVANIDVRGQTCPGYLLAINRAVDTLAPGTHARLLITYPPCGDDVRAWCRERHIRYHGITHEQDMWVIRIEKQAPARG
ncbi:MAG TPA: sulfurtransferase TusA family protein [Gammaproteobacteria bacterium]|nr:sulfurtransferase TusA family protein [Gammaproteobacteria bacterium]